MDARTVPPDGPAHSGPGEPPATGVSVEELKAAFRNHPAGVAVITADAGDGPVAMTSSSVASVSADPPLIMFSASARSSSTPTILRAKTVVIHLLAAEQLSLAKLAATSGVDRFDGTIPWSRLPTGEPHYHGVPVRIRARVVSTVAAGSSTVVVAQALQADLSVTAQARGALVYHDRAWHELSGRSRVA
ncbi:flavin reductase family protein [Amycolatopsis carbonis]|uniref:Flavin reductase family protein n=1 Tax=Amycolatopsis carbonis TaxID=715471 RepID=A0A9Y2INJ8_9PSEU|nr:flavin reductase family protein [Amycolatopsis sp. 2-15]WIX83204.1 flavin reductase family protein [Amycolatopsis sp. 2-15]